MFLYLSIYLSFYLLLNSILPSFYSYIYQSIYPFFFLCVYLSLSDTNIHKWFCNRPPPANTHSCPILRHVMSGGGNSMSSGWEGGRGPVDGGGGGASRYTVDISHLNIKYKNLVQAKLAHTYLPNNNNTGI